MGSSQSIDFSVPYPHVFFLLAKHIVCVSALRIRRLRSPGIRWDGAVHSWMATGWAYPRLHLLLFSFFFYDLVLLPKIHTLAFYPIWMGPVGSKKGRRPPLRPFAALPRLPRSGQHHPSAPPAHNNPMPAWEPVVPHRRYGLSVCCARSLKGPPHTHARPPFHSLSLSLLLLPYPLSLTDS